MLRYHEMTRNIPYTHLSDDERWDLLKHGAIVAEVCEDGTLLRFLKPNGIIYATEEWVDGVRKLVTPPTIN